MGMIFSKEEMATSSATGLKCRNPKIAQVSGGQLGQTKLDFLKKNFTFHIARDHKNSGHYNDRLKKIPFHVITKLQNNRKAIKKA